MRGQDPAAPGVRGDLVGLVGEGVEAGKAYKTSPEQAYIGAMEPDAKRTVSAIET